jgi:diguanylate cyclase (GGDEF)-like protein/PAS domain S-box-containing protein
MKELRKNNIIIVENNKTQAHVLKQLLKEDPQIFIKVAQGGEEALFLMKIQKPDLVLSNIIMPGMNGFELTKLIKNDNELKGIPVILVAEHMSPEDIIEGLESGADNFLIKPIDKVDLLKCISSLQMKKYSRLDKKSEIGLKLYFGGQEYFINEGKLQIISLLLDTIKKVHNTNIELINKEKSLNKLLEDLSRNEERFRVLFENSNDGIVICDVNGYCQSINSAFLKIIGINSKKDILQKQLPEQLLIFKKYKNIDSLHLIETEIFKKDNSKIILEAGFDKICDSEANIYFQIIIRDITERKTRDDKIKLLSFHDYLTGLYNRAFFEEEIKRLDTERMLPIGIIFGDIDNLKYINDTYGHAAGDEAIKMIADVLIKNIRHEDISARWGGDEFGIILPKTSKVNTLALVNRIKDNYKNIKLNNNLINISIGFAVKENMNEDIKIIIGNAEKEMYENKFKNKTKL